MKDKDIKEILKEFVKECSKKLKLDSIIQFGSSAYSDKFDDIDLLLCSKQEILPTSEILKLIRIIKNFEKKYDEIVFDFGGVGDRKRKAKYSITSVFLGKDELKIQYNPNDLFFFKSLSDDKNKKILFGKNIFENLTFNMTNRHLFEMLSVELKHSLRKSLDEEEDRLNSSYHLFKTFLRVMLVNEGNFEKEELIKKFSEKFENIKLPKNSKFILEHQLKENDFETILKFSEECLKYLINKK